MLLMNEIRLLYIVAALTCCVSARQIRINRFGKQIHEDNNDDDTPEVAAIVKEIKLAPYPAAGYRPDRAFNLPGEEVPQVRDQTLDDTTEDSTSLHTTTTEPALDASTTTTTADYEQDATTTDTPVDINNDVAVASATAYKAPYPPAGYRPSRVFLLPTELEAANETAATDKSDHPPCGSSTDPLAPKPIDGMSDDPDAERVQITPTVGPAVVAVPLDARPLLQIRSQPLLAQPLVIVPRRAIAYPTW